MAQTHFTISHRKMIELLLTMGKSLRFIAAKLAYHHSAIGKEISRNPSPYKAEEAQTNYERRRLVCRKPQKLANPELRQSIANLLWEGHPPETASHLVGSVSHNLIYRGIKAGILPSVSAWFLHRKRPYKRQGTEKRGTLTGFTPISERSASAEGREEFGHWEGDTVEGKNHKGYIVTLVERKTRYTFVREVAHKTAKEVGDAVISLLEEIPVLSLTFDRGKEFADFLRMERELKTKVYFCNAHAPWERGSNERTNGLIRRILPKGTDFTNLTAEVLHQVRTRLNQTLRKCVGWKTPHQLFFAELSHLN